MLRLSLVFSRKICIIFLRTVVKIWRFFACPYNFDHQCTTWDRYFMHRKLCVMFQVAGSHCCTCNNAFLFIEIILIMMSLMRILLIKKFPVIRIGLQLLLAWTFLSKENGNNSATKKILHSIHSILQALCH